MKIRRVLLSNFKSFPETVEISGISEGVNVLIGKNGAGKSSILSAIRFVMDAHQRIGPSERRVLVNENSTDLRSFVEIEFENTNKAFPAGDIFTVRRTVTQKSEEYTVDSKIVSREEMVSLFETAGVTRSMPYFVVEQGKIGELAQMSGVSRMNLIRELAGSTVYEKDKEESQRVLEESQAIEQKIEDLVQTIAKRVHSIEEDKIRKETRQDIKKKKEIIVKELYKRELHKIRAKLEELFAEDTTHSQMDITTEETEEALRMQLESILSQIPPAPAHPPKHTSLARLTQQIEQVQREQEIQERYKTEVSKEIDRLESLKAIKQAILTEVNALRMKGSACVAEKIEELKKYATHPSNLFTETKEQLLEKRRELWKMEKECQKRKKVTEMQMKENERGFLMSGKGFILSSELQALPGVVGYVYDIVNMPMEILSAISVALPHLLSSIVVHTREDGIRLVREQGIEQTVYPMHSIIFSRPKTTTPVPSLSQYISCAEEYTTLVEYLFGSIYFLSDFESAKDASKKHAINVVTANGEFFSSSGSITSGEEKASTLFKKYILSKEEYRRCLADENTILVQKKQNDQEYNSTHSQSMVDSYSEEFLFFLENEDFDVEEALLRKNTELENLVPTRTLADLEKEKEEVLAQEKREKLQALAVQIEEKLVRFAHTSWKDSLQEKARLESKFRRVQKKIFSINAEDRDVVEIDAHTKVYLREATKESLAAALVLLRKYAADIPPPIGDSDNLLQDYTRMAEKRKELANAKEKISEMQNALEIKKEQVINITVQQVKDNFEYFFKKLTQGTAKMTVSEQQQSLEIRASFGGESLVHADELSGGQRTIIALCMILAIQRIYEAPFYLMDEFDASLDTHFLSSIASSRIFEHRQLFVCTFRGETLSLGDIFYHIKDASVYRCTAEEAQSIICTLLP